MKKGFIQCITLIISAMLVFAQTYMVFAEEQQESKISAQYDATTDIFSVSGQIPEVSKKFVTVIIAPQTIDITSDKTDALADDGVIIKTEQVDSEGKIDFKIKLPEFANKPRYTYTVSLDKIVISAMFSTVSEESLSPYLSAVNSGGLSAAKDFVANSETGLDDGKTKNKDFIASYINTVKPEGGHTAKTLMDAYMIGEGLSYVKSGEMNIGEVLTEYESYLDKDYAAEYEKLPTDIKQALNEAFVNDVVVENFDTTFNNNLFVAKYTTVDNSTELKEVLLDYIEKNNISLDEFNEINNAVYEDKVFNELYETCKNKKTLTAILDAFNAEVE
ncbi:MAG: hypothetical protein II978_08155, partial [Clostridia bacterium]|nr:hypothetical protein [Clostridia bacterium]